MLPLCSRSSLAPAAARAAYIPFGVPPSPSLPQDEPPTARGRSVAPAGAAGLTAPNPSRNRARGEEPPAATLSRHGRRSRRTAPCPPRPPFRIRASQRFRPYCISVPCVPWPSGRCSRRPWEGGRAGGREGERVKARERERERERERDYPPGQSPPAGRAHGARRRRRRSG